MCLYAATADQHDWTRGKFDVVLCDISPSTTGIRKTDQYASTLLSDYAFELAKKVLKKSGNFVCKVFQGPGFDKFLLDIRKSLICQRL